MLSQVLFQSLLHTGHVRHCGFITTTQAENRGIEPLTELTVHVFETWPSSIQTFSIFSCGSEGTRTPERFTVSRFQGGVFDQPDHFHIFVARQQRVEL